MRVGGGLGTGVSRLVSGDEGISAVGGDGAFSSSEEDEMVGKTGCGH